jgi:phosphoribosylformylglycinamidine cyclo-ligase
MEKQKAYAAAGVDIDAAGRTKKRIADYVRSTFGPEVLCDIGQFGGLYAPPWQAYDNPVLVASTDSVGTKVKVASLAGVHHTVGADIVAHCADDILVQGARPLFFLDYLGIGRHDPEIVEDVVKGVAEGCRASGCALLGGEMAELPGFYAEGEYDLVGTIVGMVDRGAILDGSRVRAADVLVGLGSDGLHTNGYSLARKLLFETAGWDVDTRVDELDATVGEALLAPHRSYVSPVLSLMEDVPVRAMAHITGGGLLDNVPRSLPSGLGARVRSGSWPVLPIFTLLQRLGQVDGEEMFQVFNMGLGMVLVVPPDRADEAVRKLVGDGEAAYVVGEVVEDPDQEVRIV